MQHGPNPQAQMISTIITFAVIGVILFFRLRRMSKERPLKLEYLWIVPGIYLAMACALFYLQPPHGLGWLYCATALVVGSALGWQRGRLMHITVDPETQTLRQKGSVAAMLFLVGIIAVRALVKEAAELHFGGINLDVAQLTDILFAFVLGLFAVTRLEMFLRARRLLQEARAGRPI